MKSCPRYSPARCHRAAWALATAAILAACGGRLAAAPPAVADAVIYEVNLRAFSQAGDLDGVAARLDEIEDLGVNVIWLMPIHASGVPNRVGPLGSPYSVQDYGEVGSEYGTLSDLTTLIDGAHARGISVLMDWVPNHTAWDHPWISAHPDWYTQNGSGQIISPPGTNWNDVADLNYDNADMRAAMIAEMQHWVSQVGIDGFRVDTADFVPYDFWQEALPAVRGATTEPLLMLAEGSRADHYAAGFDLTYDWSYYNSTKAVFNSGAPATELAAANTASNGSVPAGAGKLRFTTNHDESAFDAPPAALFGGVEPAQAAYAATVAYGGTPLAYSGQEIGWQQNIPIFSKSTLDWSTGAATRQWHEQLLGVRQSHEALRNGNVDDRSNADVALVRRRIGGDDVLVAVNVRNAVSTVSTPASWQGGWNDEFGGGTNILAPSLQLQPYEVLVLSANRANIDGPYNGDSFQTGANGAAGEYQPGALVGQDRAVVAWSGPWQDVFHGQDFQVVDTGLAYRAAPVSGGGVELTSGQFGRVGRDLASAVDDATNDVLFVSFLMQAEGAAGGGQITYGGLELLTAASGREFQIVVGEDIGSGKTANYSAVLFNSDDPALAGDLGANDGDVNLFVVRFDLSDQQGQDAVAVWRNPDWQAAEPSAASADFAATGLNLEFATTALAKFGSDGRFVFDELRLGPTYLSVTSALLMQSEGDFNGDGSVDGQDFLLWQRGASPQLGSAAELAAWQAQFGSGAATATAAANSAAVAEPCSWGLLLASLATGPLLRWHAVAAGKPTDSRGQ